MSGTFQVELFIVISLVDDVTLLKAERALLREGRNRL